MQFSFGTGTLWGVPLTNSQGAAINNPTPIKFGTLQEASVELSFEVKELFGQNQYPVAVGRAKGKVSCKAKFAQIFGAAYNSLFFGQTLSSGTLITDYIDTTGQVIPATPYTIATTAIVASSTFVTDLGVLDSNGLPMTAVASAPATGQYMVSGGTYTFAAADTGKTVYINFQYSLTSTAARKVDVMNQPMGYIPTFRAELVAPYSGKSLILTLPQCVGTKLTIPTKQDDFLVPEFDFSAFADATGKVLTLATSE